VVERVAHFVTEAALACAMRVCHDLVVDYEDWLERAENVSWVGRQFGYAIADRGTSPGLIVEAAVTEVLLEIEFQGVSAKTCLKVDGDLIEGGVSVSI
jgi:hypothetical protein